MRQTPLSGVFGVENAGHSWKALQQAEAQEVLSQGRHPLGFDQLTLINSHADHLEAVEYLASFKRPAVVLAGSGMCAGGRVVNYLKAMLGDARNR